MHLCRSNYLMNLKTHKGLTYHDAGGDAQCAAAVSLGHDVAIPDAHKRHHDKPHAVQVRVRAGVALIVPAK